MVTRRAFTGILGAAAGWALAPAAPRRPKPSVFGGVQVGVQTYTFRAFDLERTIAAVREVGLTSVELWAGHLDPLRTGEAGFRAAKRRLDEAGLRVSAYSVDFPTAATDGHLERAFVGARILGTDVVTSSVEQPLVPRLDECCRRHEIRLGLHNHWLGDPWFKGDRSVNFEGPADWARALEGRSPWLGICLDVGHFSAAGHDAVAFFRDHHRRIYSLHLKDRAADPARRHTAFGAGATPLTAVLKLARDVGFPYAANIEQEQGESDPTPGIRQALDYVKRALTVCPECTG